MSSLIGNVGTIMRVLCINNRIGNSSITAIIARIDGLDRVIPVKVRSDRLAFNYRITIGRWYEVIGIINDKYCVINDYGADQYYDKNFFRTEKDIRKEKLEKINVL